MSDASPFKHANANDSARFLLWKLTALWQRRLAVVFDTAGITQTQFAIMENADDAFFGRLNARDLASYKALTVALVEGENG